MREIWDGFMMSDDCLVRYFYAWQRCFDSMIMSLMHFGLLY